MQVKLPGAAAQHVAIVFTKAANVVVCRGPISLLLLEPISPILHFPLSLLLLRHTARARNRRFWPLSALRAHTCTKAP